MRDFSILPAPHAVPQTRRVLSRDAMYALGHQLLGSLSRHSIGVTVEHVARAVTTVANGRVRITDDGDRVLLVFHSTFGADLPVEIFTNQITDTSLKQIAAQVDAMAPPPPVGGDVEDADDMVHYTYQAQPQRPSHLWYEATAQAMETGRGEVLPPLVRQLQQSNLNGSATVGVASRAVLHMYKYGLTAYADETDCEITVTARMPDGSASGWAGQATRNWTQLTPEHIAAHAIELAERGRNPSAVEPGRRTAILGPVAVAQLVELMMPYFGESGAYPRGPTWSPFSNLNHRPGERQTKLDQRVFDPRLVMRSDPNDPDGGYPPFYERYGGDSGMAGYPQGGTTWIDAGVLRQFSRRVADAISRQLTPYDLPSSMRMTTVPGTHTVTIDEMIAGCDDGIYVNRFAEVELLNTQEGRNNGIMTGYTRDGCFLVRQGKIDRPVKNFRFMESPFLAFNRIAMIGTPVRAAFGYNLGTKEWNPNARWPKLPIITPPLMIRDFNFVALSDAV